MMRPGMSYGFQRSRLQQYGYDAENKTGQVSTVELRPIPTTPLEIGSEKMSALTGPEYVRFNGQVLSEKSSDGFWSDYIYANGSGSPVPTTTISVSIERNQLP